MENTLPLMANNVVRALTNNTKQGDQHIDLFVDFTNTADSGAVLPRFLLQVMIILILTRIFGKILSFVKQPPVIGEMIAGIFVGPSVLGYAPGWTETFYPTASVPYFALVANIGLILFMFYLGLELDEQMVKKQWKQSVPIAVSAIVFPFLVGSVYSIWLYDLNNESFVDPVDRVAFTLFSGSSMCFTAFPVLASILAATRLIATPIGILTLSCAAIDDVLAWTLLAISSSFAKQGNINSGLYTLCLAIAFVLVMLFPVRMILVRIHRYYLYRDQETSKIVLSSIIFCLLASSFMAEEIGIHSFFGAFIAGLITPKSGNIHLEIAPKIELVAVEFFLPLYFANSGIKTQIGTLNDGISWLAVVCSIFVATFAKFTPSCLMAKCVTKRDWKFCTTLGILCNTRGLVELIALNIGLQSNILSPRLFTILVLMALVTTFMTSPLMWLLYGKTYDSRLEIDKQRSINEIRLVPGDVVDAQLENDAPVVTFHDPPSPSGRSRQFQSPNSYQQNHGRQYSHSGHQNFFKSKRDLYNKPTPRQQYRNNFASTSNINTNNNNSLNNSQPLQQQQPEKLQEGIEFDSLDREPAQSPTVDSNSRNALVNNNHVSSSQNPSSKHLSELNQTESQDSETSPKNNFAPNNVHKRINDYKPNDQQQSSHQEEQSEEISQQKKSKNSVFNPDDEDLKAYQKD